MRCSRIVLTKVKIDIHNKKAISSALDDMAFYYYKLDVHLFIYIWEKHKQISHYQS